MLKNDSKLACVYLCISFLAISGTSTRASETDQMTGRTQEITDSTEILNAKINASISEIIADWDAGDDRRAMVNAIYRKLGGWSIVDKIEHWAIENAAIGKHDTTRRTSVYGGLPFWSTRGIFLFPFGETLKLNGILVGSDKLSHFISQGRKFYRRFVRHGSEEIPIRKAEFVEGGVFGSLTTGSFSNADLVSNYEGYRFYRSLFEDEIIPGKIAILRWSDTGWLMQRKFDWSDHVNAYWDEALNINDFDRLLRKHMKKRFLQFCQEFANDPSLYLIENEDELAARYEALNLRDTSEFRLERLCEEKH
jgi:hypothetical protein